MHLTQSLLLCAALLLATSASAPAADNTRGAVEQSGGNIVRQNPSLPQLHLSDAQRERIRQTLLIKHTEVQFRLKTTQSAKDSNPKIGAALPKGAKTSSSEQTRSYDLTVRQTSSSKMTDSHCP